MTKQLFIVCSEFSLQDCIGGVNTFCRYLYTEAMLGQYNVNVIFFGLKCKEQPIHPRTDQNMEIQLIETPLSRCVTDVSEYFKLTSGTISIDSFQRDLTYFGSQTLFYIRQQMKSGDVLLTNMVYDFVNSIHLLRSLKSAGLTIIHAVHSLTPIKIFHNLVDSHCKDLLDWRKYLFSIVAKWFIREPCTIASISMSWFACLLPRVATAIVQTEMKLMEIATSIIVPSVQMKNLIHTFYSDADLSTKITVQPWGLPSCYICEEPKSISNNIKVIVLSKILPSKGLHILMESLLDLEGNCPELAKRLKISICGDTAYHCSVKYVESLKTKSSQLSFVNIEWLGWIAGDRKMQQLTNSDILILPSITEPFGFSVLEAMRSGCAIVSFATEGPSQIVKNTFGVLVPLEGGDTVRSTNLAKAIETVCSRNYSAMGEEAARESMKYSTKSLLDLLTK